MNKLLISEEMYLFYGGLLIILGVLGIIRLLWRKYHGSMERERWNRWFAIAIFCILFGALELAVKIFEGTCCIFIGMLTFYVEYKTPEKFISKSTYTHEGVLGIGVAFVFFGMFVILIKYCEFYGFQF